MALVDDFTVYPYSKVIRHTNVSSDSTYTVQAFYSWLMDLFDEPAYLSYESPMKYNTPTQYTLQNGWFIDNGDGSEALKYLYGGSVLTSGYAGDVRMLDIDNEGVDYVACVAGDKDLPVTDDATPVGPLLAYKNAYPNASEARWWIRDTRAVPAAIVDNSTIDVTGGTGGGQAAGADESGDEIYTNLYSIASFPADISPQVYVFQQDPDGNEARIAEWSFTDKWDRGTVDIIVPVKLGGNLINSGLIDIFARQSGDLFSHVSDVDLSAGSRTPVALETSPDEVNLTSSEFNFVDYFIFFDAQSNAISVDDIITDIDTTTVGTRPGWYAEVASVTDWGTEGVLGIRGLNGTISDDDTIYVGSTSCATVNGTVGDAWIPWSAESTGPIAGDIGKAVEGGTSDAEGILRGFQDDTGTGKLLLQVYHTHDTVDAQVYTGAGRDPLYKFWLTGENLDAPASGGSLLDVTVGTIVAADHYRAVSGFSDVTIAHVNGTVTCDTFAVSDFTVGELVTWNVGADSAVVLYTDNATTMQLGNVSSEPDASDSFVGAISGGTCECNSGLTDDNTQNYEFPLQSEGDTYNVFIEGGAIYYTGRTLDQVYAYNQFKCRDGESDVMYTSDGSSITEVQGQQYIKAVSTHATTKTSPFGTLAGGVFFGAQGVWIEGMSSADDNNIQLTSHEGNAQQPYSSIVVTVGNTRISDVITVFKEEGSTGLPDKSQFTCAANTKSASTLQGDATHPNDTPSAGWVYVVDDSTNEEHKYRFTSWTTDTLTLAAEVIGTADGSTTGQTLQDTGIFLEAAVQRGDIIRRTGDDAWCYIISRDNDNQVTTTVLSDGTDWAVSDNFEVNSLVVDYTSSDSYFIPYLEAIEDSDGSESDTLTYVENRAVVIRVRNVLNATKIQPFVTTSDILSGGMTVSVIRNTDDVYS